MVGPDDKERIVRARGGQAGLAGSGKRTKSELISLSAVVFANSIEVRNGLAFMLGGGWETYSFLKLPVDVNVPIRLIIEAGGAPKTEYTIRVEVRNPYDDILGWKRHSWFQRRRQRFQCAAAVAWILPSHMSSTSAVIAASSAEVTTARSSVLSCSGLGRRYRTFRPAVM
jgi:hypothetical protein